MLLAYEIQGKKRKRRWWKVLVVITIIVGSCIAVIYQRSICNSENFRECKNSSDGISNRFNDKLYTSHNSKPSSETLCRQTAKGYFDCSTDEAKEKAKEIKTWYVQIETIKAYVTAYSSEESPGINAKGLRPKQGRSIACPRKIPFGMGVRINGGEYVCDDRTALRYDGRFDLFVGSRKEAVEWGKRWKEVTVYYDP